MEKVYFYNEFGFDDPLSITEQEILDRYWSYWFVKMTDKFGSDHSSITAANCIDDWLAVNWAWAAEDKINEASS